MQTIPERLISDENKVAIIRENYCNDCCIYRRTDLKRLLTPAYELGADVWSTKHLFDLSTNIYLCNTHELGIESKKDDVNIILTDNNYEIFNNDVQSEKIVPEDIMVKVVDTIIVYMQIGYLESIKGTYPFNRGTQNEKHYQYTLKVRYDPLVLNAFHFTLQVLSDEYGGWSELQRNDIKGYQRTLATSICAQILKDKKIHILK